MVGVCSKCMGICDFPINIWCSNEMCLIIPKRSINVSYARVMILYFVVGIQCPQARTSQNNVTIVILAICVGRRLIGTRHILIEDTALNVTEAYAWMLIIVSIRNMSQAKNLIVYTRAVRIRKTTSMNLIFKTKCTEVIENQYPAGTLDDSHLRHNIQMYKWCTL